MEGSDKSSALNKAYAEIVLNTAKEAAARVMLSERKAVRFQQDLCGVKEEEYRLLVRLKQMIDAKAIEAEITSSNQQRRIDELEAQLQEAEDIVTDLRFELNWARCKSAKARISNSQSRITTNSVEETISSENADMEFVGSLNPNQGLAHTSISEVMDVSARSLHNKCGYEVKQFEGLRVSDIRDFDGCESELDMIMRKKELELYRNGCTQRIRALGRNVLEGNPSSYAEDQGTTAKDDNENLSSGEVDKDRTGVQGNNRRCTVLALRAMSVQVITRPPNQLETKKISKKVRRRKRRKRGWGKPKASLVRSHAYQAIKPVLSYSKTSMDNASGESSSKTYPSEESEDGDAMKACKGLEEHLQHKRTQYIDKIAIIRNGKWNKNMKILDSIPCQESTLLYVNGNVDEDKAQVPEKEDKIKSLPHLDNRLTPISETTNLTVSSKATNQSKPGAEKDLESENKDALVKCGNRVVSSTKMGSEMVDVNPVNGVSGEINESQRKVDGNRVLKYTFQRKRKKRPLSDNDDNISPAKGKVEEKENDGQEANESSRGARRLVQVARQLISVSVKRW
ncbi:PREDICTED: uncharacterized protein LOC104822818 isoform X2 [Tarenaya hassleriana]|uniref:uncharacterized protein LOC104822818 isoform X2 n=1 Tax=Tarenaya hassleriana TaxID=28532 RepID=UPI00053C97F2|nr:PREDICTED: uncharacterized protein LOC104822818 isoform X2 [Tarenaya hassleriana]